MTRQDASERAADLAALTAFVVDNPDLDRLYALTGGFNIFEALGVTRQELRHSDFLAFLLDPRQPHGLGDAFAQRFLQRVLVQPGQPPAPISAVEVVLTPFTNATVLREWTWIDLLLVSEDHRLAVIIENKVGAGEQRGQLARYEDAVRRRYGAFRILKLFLTPNRTAPSDPSWFAIDYGVVAACVEDVSSRLGDSIDPVVRALLAHYVALLRRHVVTDSEIADLCRSIYRKHQRALDLIVEHRPDPLSRLAEVLVEAVEATPGIVLVGQERGGVRFAPKTWEVEPLLHVGEDGVPVRIMGLYVRVAATAVELFLVIDPGPQALRQAVTSLARAARPVLRVRGAGGQNWTTIYRRPLLDKRSASRTNGRASSPTTCRGSSPPSTRNGSQRSCAKHRAYCRQRGATIRTTNRPPPRVRPRGSPLATCLSFRVAFP